MIKREGERERERERKREREREREREGERYIITREDMMFGMANFSINIEISSIERFRF